MDRSDELLAEHFESGFQSDDVFPSSPTIDATQKRPILDTMLSSESEDSETEEPVLQPLNAKVTRTYGTKQGQKGTGTGASSSSDRGSSAKSIDMNKIICLNGGKNLTIGKEILGTKDTHHTTSAPSKKRGRPPKSAMDKSNSTHYPAKKIGRPRKTPAHNKKANNQGASSNIALDTNANKKKRKLAQSKK
ncbi:hypothetical protein BJV82DRAFT_394000 [Fennellomyces sp. T-0311]|nr:hypothetical protein BJV82DRAFT_394000 [Fennellomyces sp. T-0311]